MTYEETVTLDRGIKVKVEFIRVGEQRGGSNGIR